MLAGPAMWQLSSPSIVGEEGAALALAGPGVWGGSYSSFGWSGGVGRREDRLGEAVTLCKANHHCRAGWATPDRRVACPHYLVKHGHMDQLATCEIFKNLHIK